MWRRILDSLPWESSKLCCTQTTVSSLGCVIPHWCVFVLYVQTNVCLCVFFLLLLAELQRQWFFFSPHLSLSSFSLPSSLSVLLSLFSALWNVQFCAVGVGLSVPWR